jgi:hypothetical protein
LETLENRLQPGSVLTGSIDIALLSSNLALLAEGALAPISDLTESRPENHRVTQQSISGVTEGSSAALALAGISMVENPMHQVSTDDSLALQLGYVGAGSGGGPLAFYDPLWYNGDFDGRSGLANEEDDAIGIGNFSHVYDNVDPPQTWIVNQVYSNNLMSFQTDLAYYEIRIGMGPGNCGSIVTNTRDLPAAGYVGARTVGHGPGGFGLLEYTVDANIVPVVLQGGERYWLTVAPVANQPAAIGRSFISTSSGLGAFGYPGAGTDDLALWNSNIFGANCDDVRGILGEGTWDFSMGMQGRYM